MAEGGVGIIRTGLIDDNIDFIIKAYRHGISSGVICRSRFNGDIADPGSGRELGLKDLNSPNDAEEQAVANGYRTYLKVLAALKALRDHSKINQRTPIVSAGLTPWGPPSPKSLVSYLDTIEFFVKTAWTRW